MTEIEREYRQGIVLAISALADALYKADRFDNEEARISALQAGVDLTRSLITFGEEMDE